MPTRPRHILTIGALESPHRLRAAGCTMSHAPTLLLGYQQATHGLAAPGPARPTVILLDLNTSEPGFGAFAAPQLAAVLAHAMHQGRLQPAWLVGLAPPTAPDLDPEAYLAGCHLVLHAPLHATMHTGLSRLAGLPAHLPPTDRATAAYQRAALRVLHAVQAAQIRDWTADDVLLLLGWLTRYPIPEALLDRLHGPETTRVLRALGEPQAAHARLLAIAEGWQRRYRLHGAILKLLLDGWERPAIVAYYVERRLYEDSRIYFCLKELPERIAQELRIREARAEGAGRA